MKFDAKKYQNSILEVLEEFTEYKRFFKNNETLPKGQLIEELTDTLNDFYDEYFFPDEEPFLDGLYENQLEKALKVRCDLVRKFATEKVNEKDGIEFEGTGNKSKLTSKNPEIQKVLTEMYDIEDWALEEIRRLDERINFLMNNKK